MVGTTVSLLLVVLIPLVVLLRLYLGLTLRGEAFVLIADVDEVTFLSRALLLNVRVLKSGRFGLPTFAPFLPLDTSFLLKPDWADEIGIYIIVFEKGDRTVVMVLVVSIRLVNVCLRCCLVLDF